MDEDNKKETKTNEVRGVRGSRWLGVYFPPTYTPSMMQSLLVLLIHPVYPIPSLSTPKTKDHLPSFPLE